MLMQKGIGRSNKRAESKRKGEDLLGQKKEKKERRKKKPVASAKALAHFFQSKFLVIIGQSLDFMQKNLSIVLLLLFLCLSISVILLLYCYSDFRNSFQADSSVVLHSGLL